MVGLRRSDEELPEEDADPAVEVLPVGGLFWVGFWFIRFCWGRFRFAARFRCSCKHPCRAHLAVVAGAADQRREAVGGQRDAPPLLRGTSNDPVPTSFSCSLHVRTRAQKRPRRSERDVVIVVTADQCRVAVFGERDAMALLRFASSVASSPSSFRPAGPGRAESVRTPKRRQGFFVAGAAHERGARRCPTCHASPCAVCMVAPVPGAQFASVLSICRPRA